MSLTLSPEHGVNPSLEKCMACGKDSDTIVMHGRLPKDEKAPQYLAGREPCGECIAKFESYKEKGIVLFAIDDQYGGDLREIQAENEVRGLRRHRKKLEPSPWQYFKKVYVIKEEAAKRMFPDTDLSQRALFLDFSVAEQIGLEAISPTDNPPTPSTSLPG